MRYTNSLGIGADDRLTLLQGPAFSGAVSSMFGALLNGAAVFPFDVPPGWGGPHCRLARDARDHHVPFGAGPVPACGGRRSLLPDVRVVRLEGDLMSPRDVELFQARFEPGTVLVNGLGATECGLVRQHVIDHGTPALDDAVPIGYPVEDMNVALLDSGGSTGRRRRRRRDRGAERLPGRGLLGPARPDRGGVPTGSRRKRTPPLPDRRHRSDGNRWVPRAPRPARSAGEGARGADRGRGRPGRAPGDRLGAGGRRRGYARRRRGRPPGRVRRARPAAWADHERAAPFPCRPPARPLHSSAVRVPGGPTTRPQWQSGPPGPAGPGSGASRARRCARAAPHAARGDAGGDVGRGPRARTRRRGGRLLRARRGLAPRGRDPDAGGRRLGGRGRGDRLRRAPDGRRPRRSGRRRPGRRAAGGRQPRRRVRSRPRPPPAHRSSSSSIRITRARAVGALRSPAT